MSDNSSDTTKDEAAAAEWESMVNKEPKNNGDANDADAWSKMLNEDEGGGGNPKTLDQNEIDQLIGDFNQNKDNENSNRGIKNYIDRSMKSYQRLPMLEIVFDRFARIFSTTLRNMTSENVDVDIRAINSLRFGDYINSIPMPALVSIFKVVEWENFGLIIPDGQFIYSMVDILFGGRKQNQPVRFDGRPFTNIELSIFKYLCDITLNDMGSAFEPINPSTFVHERIETNPRFASIARPGDPVILIELYVSMEDRNGKLEILIPYATLEPIRELLTQVFMGEKFGKDNNWESHIQNEVYNARISLEAVLAEKFSDLEEVINFKPGQTIIFENKYKDEVKLACEKINLLAGNLGSVEEKIAVSITKAVHKKLIEIIK
jgi:flagellar motor switch protein FliM